MASQPGPYGFTQYLQGINRPQLKKIWRSFIKPGSVWTHMPMVNEGSMIKAGKRVVAGLPVATFVQVSQEPTTPFVQDLESFEEGVALARDFFKIDELLQTDKWYIEGNPVGFNSKMYFDGRTFTLNNYFFNNDKVQGPIADAGGFVGLKYRLAYPTKWKLAPGMSIQATADLSDAGLAGTGAIKIARDIQRMLSHFGNDDGSNMVAWASAQCMWQLDAIVKSAGQAGGFTTAKDAFGRSIVEFKNLRIVSCGFQPPSATGQQTTPIIADSQDVNGWDVGDASYTGAGLTGATGYTTMFFAQLGGNYLTGWQHSDPTMIKERLSGTHQIVGLFQLTAGIFMEDNRSIGRIYGIKVNGPLYD